MAHKNRQNWSPYKSRQDANTKKPRVLSGRHRKPESIHTIEEANDRLLDIFRNHSFSHISHQQRHQLAHFYVLLMQNQEKENFTRLLKLRDVAIKHFIDCLMIPKLTTLDFPLLDVGTGPGIPGIPLKIFFPEERILLAESVQKRVDFLKKVREEMNLKNLDIFGRVINNEFEYPVGGVITRAVEDARNTLGNVVACLPVGGRVFLMKGPGVAPEIKPAAEAWGEYFTLEQDIAYELPQTPHQRRLLIYKKIKRWTSIRKDED